MKRTIQMTLITLLAIAFVLAGCGSNHAGNNDANNSNQGNKSADKKEITIAYVAWDSEIASNHVVKHVMENYLDYDVNLLQVEAGPMWAGVAGGSADAMVAAWLPGTHATYFAENEGKFEDLGPNLDGAKIGLVVPTYMDIDSIEDFKNATVAEQLDYTITGIEPGAGIMEATSNAIVEYELDGWNILESSSTGMTISLEQAYEDEKPIVVTGWTPHWKFAKYDLKYLEDPKKIYGETEQIHTIVRLGLKDDDPVAYSFLDNFNWTADDMATVMIDIEDGATADEAAAKWVEANQEKVNSWLEGIQ